MKNEPYIINLSLSKAISLLQKQNIPYRIVEEDGEHRLVTSDFKPERVGLYILNNKVIKTTKG